ncbi:MAG: SRPBCC family protein [Acidimicrobiales bacterium]
MALRRKKTAVDDEVSIVIDAPADRLYDIVSDVSKMGRLSPECTGGKWLGGAKGPSVDARFKGRNRRGPVMWSTTNTVVAANRGREFAFETKQSGTRWRYRFEPVGDGDNRTVVTESREPWRSRPMVARVFSVLFLGGIKDHDEEMREGMRASLERLKSVAESAEKPTRRRRRKGRATASA